MSRMSLLLLLLSWGLVILLSSSSCHAFLGPRIAANSSNNKSSRHSASATSTSIDYEFVLSDQEGFLNGVAGVLIDGFWCDASSTHTMMLQPENPIDDNGKRSLWMEQASDLQSRYGENGQLGKRLLQSAVIAAIDPTSNQMVGVVTIKEGIRTKSADADDNNEWILLDEEEAEVQCKQAVAQLGPKQRRQYKNASPRTIVDELLNTEATEYQCMVLLSNLAVVPSARRQGLGQALCQQAEQLVQDDWNYHEMHLLVEKANTAGVTLYQDKLGYKVLMEQADSTVLRVDATTASFVEVQADLLCMVKQLQ